MNRFISDDRNVRKSTPVAFEISVILHVLSNHLSINCSISKSPHFLSFKNKKIEKISTLKMILYSFHISSVTLRTRLSD